MMKTYALVDENGSIKNIILWDGKDPIELDDGIQAIDCASEACMIGGVFREGKFYPPVADELTKEELQAQAEQLKSSSMDYAKDMISVLQDAVDLEMASETELTRLQEFKKYRVLLSRIDTSLAPEIKWPQVPVGQ